MLEDIYKTVKEKMNMAIDILRKDFAGLRTGKASVTLLEKIKVSCYNTTLPLNQVATITVPDPHQIIVQPWDKTILQDIEKAILTSDLGLTPVKDGNVLRISVPPLSRERREELTKVIRRKAEEGRVAIRNIRREILENVKKYEGESRISEDEARIAREKIQKITDECIADLNAMAENKIEEIMQF